MRRSRPTRALTALTLLVVLLGAGCARHMPVADIGERGGDIGVRVVTVTGEVVTGQLLALDEEELVVRVTRRETGEQTDRGFPMNEVSSATVHRTRSEASWGSIVSTLVGVAGGVLIATALKEWGP